MPQCMKMNIGQYDRNGCQDFDFDVLDLQMLKNLGNQPSVPMIVRHLPLEKLV